MLASPSSSTLTASAMLASSSPTTQERRDDEIDLNPPPAYGAFAFHLAGDTQASRPASVLSESSSSIRLTPPSPSLTPVTTQESDSGSIPDEQCLPIALASSMPPPSSALATASAPHIPPTDSPQFSQSELLLIEVDQDLVKVKRLLSEIAVLIAEQELPSSTSRTPLTTFRELNSLELYHSNPQKCHSGLAKERQRLLKARQALRIQWIGVQAQSERQRESSVATNTNTMAAAEAAERSHLPVSNSRSTDETSGPLSSASVALTVALHEASTERLAELQVIDKTIADVRMLIRTLTHVYPAAPTPKDLFGSSSVFHLFHPDRPTAVKGLFAELEQQRKLRLELMKTHQELHVQGLVAQMRWFK